MSNLINRILSNGASQLLDSLGGVVDNFTTTEQERQSLKLKIAEAVNSHYAKLAKLQAEVMKTELSGNWLQRSWRPLLMLTFAGLLVMRWMGFTTTIPTEVELQLMDIIKIGIGGYVVGRSAEKITQNLDLGSLRKKDRKDFFQR